MTLCACAPAGPPTERVAIPALHASLDVPIGTVVALADDGASFTLDTGGRMPRSFEISTDSPAHVGEVHRRLAKGVSVTYSVRLDPGGDGGHDSLLTGALTFGDRDLTFVCHEHGQWPDTPHATWCLRWLATLRVDA